MYLPPLKNHASFRNVEYFSFFVNVCELKNVTTYLQRQYRMNAYYKSNPVPTAEGRGTESKPGFWYPQDTCEAFISNFGVPHCSTVCSFTLHRFYFVPDSCNQPPTLKPSCLFLSFCCVCFVVLVFFPQQMMLTTADFPRSQPFPQVDTALEWLLCFVRLF